MSFLASEKQISPPVALNVKVALGKLGKIREYLFLFKFGSGNLERALGGIFRTIDIGVTSDFVNKCMRECNDLSSPLRHGH